MARERGQLMRIEVGGVFDELRLNAGLALGPDRAGQPVDRRDDHGGVLG
jgi:hypothetical protein